MAGDEASHGIGGQQLFELGPLRPAGDDGGRCGVGDIGAFQYP